MTSRWNNFDEYQEYQIFGMYANNNNYLNSDASEDNEEEREEREIDYNYEDNEEVKKEIEEQKNISNSSNYSNSTTKSSSSSNSNISYIPPLPSEEIIEIIRYVKDSCFNSFGRIVYDKPDYNVNTNAHIYGNLTVSYISNPMNEKTHKLFYKDFIEEVFNIILNIISKDKNFKIEVHNSFYQMDVSYIQDIYNEKFKVSLFVDKTNNYNVIIEMKGIKKDNVCNLFFFYNIHKALGDFYDVKGYRESNEEEIGIDFLPHTFKKSIYLNF